MGFAVFGGQRDYRHGRSARALPRLLAGLSLTALGLGLGVSGACSLIVDFTECRDNNDCASIDGSGPVRACTSENICVEAAEIECTGNTQCGDLFGSSFVCGADEEGAARCVNTTTAECEPIIWPEDWDHDKVVILGTVMPVGELFAALVQPLENAVQLAIQDFNKTTELPGGRKIAWVACNSNGVPDLAVAASDHLANRLHAPAIIGPIFSENVIKVATEVTIPAGTFTITPAASSPSITTLDDDDLVWRPISSDVYQASAIADWVTKVQDPAPDSVVFLAKDDAYGQGLLIDAGGRIEQNVGSFTSITYSNPATLTTEELTAEYGAVIGQTFALAPDTVIIAGTSEAQEFILGYLLVWGDLPEAERPALPVFLVPHAGVPILESTLESVPDPLLQQLLYTKLAGVAPIIHDVENFAVYNSRYKVLFGNKDAITSSSLSYDAALVTILAMATVDGQERVTGAGIASGMARLVDKAGTPISFGDDPVGLSFIRDARNILEQGGGVDLKGVSGELDFDLSTGEVRVNLINWKLIERSAGDPSDALIAPNNVYVLNDEPATDGNWISCEVAGC
ncbi:MAG: ABC transporter substrate-binding protein [Myxococcales bacterium]|nr:ABC transporter substrate-binding protein [Myxococcales bacterium]